jgi:hypothetical protein
MLRRILHWVLFFQVATWAQDASVTFSFGSAAGGPGEFIIAGHNFTVEV